MRIVFCGSGSVATPVLGGLGKAGHEVAAVFTQPPRPAGRGGKLRPTPAAEAARELALPVRPVANINDAENVAAVAALKADAMVVVDFGQMIRAPAREATALGAYNVHGSLLPALRGAAPANWAIIRGLRETGVTTFRLVDRMDAGDVFVRQAVAIAPGERADELRARLAAAGAEAMVETLALLAAGRTAGEGQDESAVTHAPLLTKANGVIDWSAEATAVRDLIHGTWPWPGGQARYVAPDGKGVDVIIARAEAVEGEPGGAGGAVTDDKTVATGSGRLSILEIKPAGKRLMAWRDFVNGHRVGPGARFEPVVR